MENLHGRMVVRIGNRYFAIRKDIGKADRIHAATQLGSTWERQMSKPSIRIKNTRKVLASHSA